MLLIQLQRPIRKIIRPLPKLCSFNRILRLHLAIPCHANPRLRPRLGDPQQLLREPIHSDRLSLGFNQGREPVHPFDDVGVLFAELREGVECADGVAVFNLGVGEVVEEVWDVGVLG